MGQVIPRTPSTVQFSSNMRSATGRTAEHSRTPVQRYRPTAENTHLHRSDALPALQSYADIACAASPRCCCDDYAHERRRVSSDLRTPLHSAAMAHRRWKGSAVDFPEVVRQVVDEARRNAGSGPALARELQKVGAAPESGRYSESAISNWSKGRAMPPSDVLLAAAFITGISIDAKLAQSTTEETENGLADSAIQELRNQIADLQQKYGRLQALLMDLYARTGQPYPHETRARETGTERAVGE